MSPSLAKAGPLVNAPVRENEFENILAQNILDMMTSLEEEILKLPKLQKIKIMEKLWADLSQEADLLELPSWHARELEDTERRVEEGKEHFEDWSEAKRRLRES